MFILFELIRFYFILIPFAYILLLIWAWCSTETYTEFVEDAFSWIILSALIWPYIFCLFIAKKLNNN